MSDNQVPEPVTRSRILFYQSENGTSHIEVRLEEGTVWLSQALIADLYQITKQTTGHHIRSIFDEKEHSPETTVRQYLTVQTEGSRTVKRSIEYYNLDMILSIGYRVRSHRGTQFRRWATERLSEYLIKGFVLDDERLRERRSIGTWDTPGPDRKHFFRCSRSVAVLCLTRHKEHFCSFQKINKIVRLA